MDVFEPTHGCFALCLGDLPEGDFGFLSSCWPFLARVMPATERVSPTSMLVAMPGLVLSFVFGAVDIAARLLQADWAIVGREAEKQR